MSHKSQSNFKIKTAQGHGHNRISIHPSLTKDNILYTASDLYLTQKIAQYDSN